MKIYALLLLTASTRPADIRAAEYELSQFGFFQRGKVQEFINFTSQTLAERTQPGQRQSVEQDSYLIHCFVRPGDKLAAVIITDQEYPLRVSFTILSQCIEDFSVTFPSDTWSTLTPATAGPQFPALRDTLTKYQDPHAADNLMRVQKELDETKIVLHHTLKSVLDREEKLETLVDRSNALSASTRAFYKTAQKNNQCCSLM